MPFGLGLSKPRRPWGEHFDKLSANGKWMWAEKHGRHLIGINHGPIHTEKIARTP
jgi:hypothetical protein